MNHPLNMDTFAGMPIVSSPYVPKDRPKIQLSPEVQVTDAFRIEMNLWLDEFFGREAVVYVIDPRVSKLLHASLERDAEKAMSRVGTTAQQPMTFMNNEVMRQMLELIKLNENGPLFNKDIMREL